MTPEENRLPFSSLRTGLCSSFASFLAVESHEHLFEALLAGEQALDRIVCQLLYQGVYAAVRRHQQGARSLVLSGGLDGDSLVGFVGEELEAL